MIVDIMKTFLSLLAASLIVGLACFVIFHFVFSFDESTSLSISISAAIAGIIGEYLRPYFKSLAQKQKDTISKRARRNLKRREES
jgi:membrane associated rhomboid family serine protease